jgi:hypothetical protein
VEAVRISTNFDPLDGAPIQIDDRLIRLPHAHAVSDGTSFVVFWTDDFRRNIFAQRVGRDGTLQGPRALVSHGLLNDVVWDGHAYALAIADTWAAYVTHLGADLQPRGDTSFITAYAPIVEASLAPERSGLLAIYLRRAFDELSGGVYRAFIRTPVPAPARARSAGR